MRKSYQFFKGITVYRSIVIFSLLLFFSVSYSFATGNEIVKFNSDYKLKRVSGTTVSVYQMNKVGEKVEYTFNDFNADVLLLLYRNVEIDQIASNLTKKYHLDKTDCRRHLKRALNTLEEWDIIVRNR